MRTIMTITKTPPTTKKAPHTTYTATVKHNKNLCFPRKSQNTPYGGMFMVCTCTCDLCSEYNQR